MSCHSIVSAKMSVSAFRWGSLKHICTNALDNHKFSTSLLTDLIYILIVTQTLVKHEKGKISFDVTLIRNCVKLFCYQSHIYMYFLQILINRDSMAVRYFHQVVFSQGDYVRHNLIIPYSCRACLQIYFKQRGSTITVTTRTCEFSIA